MRATSASLSYGRGSYPTAEPNLPDLPIEPVIAAARAAMGKLAGCFTLDEPDFVNLEIIGNGYVVRLNYENPEFFVEAAREATT